MRGAETVDKRNVRGFLSIKGKVVLPGKRWLLTDKDVVLRILSGSLERAGLKDVKPSGTNSITFQGAMSGKSFFKRPLIHDYTISHIVKRGMVSISTAGPDLEASYFIKPDYWAIIIFLPLLVFLGFFLWGFLWGFLNLFHPGFYVPLVVISSCLLSIAGIIPFIPHRVIRRDLGQILESTDKMLNFKKVEPDISRIETRHRSYNPESLLRTALYYRYKGQNEKGMHYLTLLIRQFPGAKEAAIAFEELKIWAGRDDGVEKDVTRSPDEKGL